MYVKRVAIVSSDPILVRFFSLECQLRDCEVHVFSKMPAHIDGYDRVFVDIDTVRKYATDHARIVTVSAAHMGADTKRLPWPVRVEELCDALLASAEESVSVPEDEAVLWMQSRKRRELRFGFRVAELSVREWMLFEALAQNEKKPVERETLMHVFDAEAGNIVDVYICHLRKKLERLCDRRVITTVRGVGYCLEIPVREEKYK